MTKRGSWPCRRETAAGRSIFRGASRPPPLPPPVRCRASPTPRPTRRASFKTIPTSSNSTTTAVAPSSTTPAPPAGGRARSPTTPSLRRSSSASSAPMTTTQCSCRSGWRPSSARRRKRRGWSSRVTAGTRRASSAMPPDGSTTTSPPSLPTSSTSTFRKGRGTPSPTAHASPTISSRRSSRLACEWMSPGRWRGVVGSGGCSSRISTWRRWRCRRSLA